MKETVNSIHSFYQASYLHELVKNILEKKSPVVLSSVIGSLRSLLSSYLYEKTNKPIFILTSDFHFDLYKNDLDLLLPKNSLVPYDIFPSKALYKLSLKLPTVVLSSCRASTQRVSPNDNLTHKVFLLENNQDISYDSLLAWLRKESFEQKEFVEHEGEYSIRGGIVDIFSYSCTSPYRIEFSGNTVTSIRTFDVYLQTSSKSILQATILPNYVQEKGAHTIFDYLTNDFLVIADIEHESDETQAKIKEKLAPFKTAFFQEQDKGIDIGARSVKNYTADFLSLSKKISNSKNTYISVSSKKEFKEISKRINAETPNLKKDSFHIAKGPLFEGFQVNGIALYTTYNITGKLHRRFSRKKSYGKRISLREMRSMKVGDYLIHEDHGIGKFLGLERISVEDSTQDCAIIEYYDNKKLFVNVQKIHLLSKYASSSSQPPLSKLGSSTWNKEKAKKKKKIKDIARKLISLYAKRRSLKAPLLKRGAMLNEFETTFIFEETPDQKNAIEDIYKDLEVGYPMDRLICGDAGYGKTEVAMRATCVALESNKQVSLLAPTTILAHQHYKTFKSRFSNLPVRIEAISRFISKAKLLQILKDVKEGRIDILISTHRGLFNKVSFKSLGLLIIDEEQRFGVETKEDLREKFPNVHTLQLSATPIPRTLQLSMVGARAISIISTPPKNRQVTETYVYEFNEELISEAISQELNRNGQVFFLHNRIQSLQEIYDLLKKLFPTIRIAVAHGKMKSKDIETVMFDFIEREIDILISTTIIGLGVDISNANTIIINRADLFGLADLYQLRGRVGRSDRKAYCYLFSPPKKNLSKDAIARLSAIEELTSMGDGLSISLQDLDIRGAGELFGAEQSGFISQFGFEAYQKALDDAVTELKLSEFKDLFSEDLEAGGSPAIGYHQNSSEVTVFFDAFIPEYYVESQKERFNLYSRLSKAKHLNDVDSIAHELKDRFGEPPCDALNLIRLSKIKIVASRLFLSKLEITPKKVSFTLPDSPSFYSSSLFLKIITAVQSEELAPYNPIIKDSKLIVITATIDPEKASPEKAYQVTKQILSTFKKKETIAETESKI